MRRRLCLVAGLMAMFASGHAQFIIAWSRIYDGIVTGPDRAYAVAVDKRGNTYITGQSDEPATGTNFVTIKYSPEGVQMWKRSYVGVGGDI